MPCGKMPCERASAAVSCVSVSSRAAAEREESEREEKATHPPPDRLLPRRARRPAHAHLPVQARRAQEALCEALRLGRRERRGGQGAREGPQDVRRRVAHRRADRVERRQVVVREALRAHGVEVSQFRERRGGRVGKTKRESAHAPAWCTRRPASRPPPGPRLSRARPCAPSPRPRGTRPAPCPRPRPPRAPRATAPRRTHRGRRRRPGRRRARGGRATGARGTWRTSSAGASPARAGGERASGSGRGEARGPTAGRERGRGRTGCASPSMSSPTMTSTSSGTSSSPSPSRAPCTRKSAIRPASFALVRAAPAPARPSAGAGRSARRAYRGAKCGRRCEGGAVERTRRSEERSERACGAGWVGVSACGGWALERASAAHEGREARNRGKEEEKEEGGRKANAPTPASPGPSTPPRTLPPAVRARHPSVQSTSRAPPARPRPRARCARPSAARAARRRAPCPARGARGQRGGGRRR